MLNPSSTQIGKAGELLVQMRLLLVGIDSSALSTDAGIDLVAYSTLAKRAVTIQVKSNLKPKPGGGKGRLALDWWIPVNSPAEVMAFVDLSDSKIWLLTKAELSQLAQQTSSGRHHLYIYTDSATGTHKRKTASSLTDFEPYRFENRIAALFA